MLSFAVLCKLINSKLNMVFQVLLGQHTLLILMIAKAFLKFLKVVFKETFRTLNLACVLKFQRELHSTYICQFYELIPHKIHCMLIKRRLYNKILTYRRRRSRASPSCVNSHQLSQWEPVIFDHPQNRRPLTDR